MSKHLSYIIPSSPAPIEEIFAVHQTTHQFYQEVEARLEFRRYCEWYKATAGQNRQELAKMRGELNIFSWFCRR